MARFRFLVPFFIGWFAPALAHARLALDWPVACEVGKTCEIQHYVDHGLGAAAQDYRCGTVTYKGHNGTDIRLLTMSAERAGVDVLAAAAGRVLRTRDNMQDISVAETGRDALQGRDCGNGVVIAHAEGFETQYCHMAKGSLVVKPGDIVAAGQKLGHVGLSGDTEFPHLHITVFHDGKMIDPFAYGEPEGACSGGVSLWNPSLKKDLEYKTSVVLNAGLAPRMVTPNDIDNGLGDQPLTHDSAAIVAFVRAITLREGDVQRIVLTGPHGRLVDHSMPPLTANKDQVFIAIGKKRPAPGWDPGEYKATYSVLRAGQVVIDQTFTARIGS